MHCTDHHLVAVGGYFGATDAGVAILVPTSPARLQVEGSGVYSNSGGKISVTCFVGQARTQGFVPGVWRRWPLRALNSTHLSTSPAFHSVGLARFEPHDHPP